jgi:CheY-like chemotaxis protein
VDTFLTNQSPIHVLVVEDELFSRLHAIDLIERAGYAPVEAANADEAIAILEARKDIRIVLRTSICRDRWMVLNSLTRSASAGPQSNRPKRKKSLRD